MKRLALLVSLAAVIVSCRPAAPNLGAGLAMVVQTLGDRIRDGIRNATVLGTAIYMTAEPMCDRTEPELLGSTGEVLWLGAQLPCHLKSATRPGGHFHLVALGTDEYEADLVPVASVEDWSEACEAASAAVPELSSDAGDMHLYVYFARSAEPPWDQLVRLGFCADVQPGGEILVECQSAALVAADDVQFVESARPE